MTAMNVDVDIDRLMSELHTLAAMSDCSDPPPAVTRVVFSDTDLRARRYLQTLYDAADLTVRVDPIGNTFARWGGVDADAAVVGTGSHTDAIPHSGMFDGTVGVLGGLEALRSLKRAGFRPRRSIELVMFTSEEPTRFGVGCTGSRAMAGLLSAGDLQQLKDDTGQDYDAIRRAAGFTGEAVDTVLPVGYFDSWVELHIEQGPELEAQHLPIGIVTAIAAPASLVFTIDGEGGHAGAVLMPQRKDALCAAAEMINVVESVARSSDSPDLVATVGQLQVHPGAINSIPSRIRFSLDIRDTDGEVRDRAAETICSQVDRIAAGRGVNVQPEWLNADPPAMADSRIIASIEKACAVLGVGHQRMISRAYHDSLFMARIAPMGMLFIPCRDGVSHRPDEFSSPEHIATGVEVLAHTLAELAT